MNSVAFFVVISYGIIDSVKFLPWDPVGSWIPSFFSIGIQRDLMNPNALDVMFSGGAQLSMKNGVCRSLIPDDPPNPTSCLSGDRYL